MTVTIWHNPRCSKSRQTLALIEAQGIPPAVVEYLKDTPSREDITEAVKLLGHPGSGSRAQGREGLQGTGACPSPAWR
jgi:arsenate reductase